MGLWRADDGKVAGGVGRTRELAGTIRVFRAKSYDAGKQV